MKRFGSFSAASSFSYGLVNKILKKNCPFESKIFAYWSMIVDDEAAKYLSPIKITEYKNYKKEIEKVLHLASPNSAMSMLFEYKKELIVQRINQYFGKNIIHKIMFVNNHNINLNTPMTAISVREVKNISLIDDEDINIKLNQISDLLHNDRAKY